MVHVLQGINYFGKGDIEKRQTLHYKRECHNKAVKDRSTGMYPNTNRSNVSYTGGRMYCLYSKGLKKILPLVCFRLDPNFY